jgi:hypothetical protein
MSRFLLLICICLTMAWLTGCALCRARHAACDCTPMASTACEECQPASGVTMPGPIYEGNPGLLGNVPDPTVGAIASPPRR